MISSNNRQPRFYSVVNPSMSRQRRSRGWLACTRCFEYIQSPCQKMHKRNDNYAS